MEGDGGEGVVAIVQGLQDAGLAVMLMSRAHLENTLRDRRRVSSDMKVSEEATTAQQHDKRDSSAQICDGRYASSYQLAHCHLTPASPITNYAEFPPQRLEPSRSIGNFDVRGRGSVEIDQTVIPSPTLRTTTSKDCKFLLYAANGGSPSVSDSFAHSLRKYPLSADRSVSSELVQRLLNYTHTKHLSRNNSSSLRCLRIKSSRLFRDKKVASSVHKGMQTSARKTSNTPATAAAAVSSAKNLVPSDLDARHNSDKLNETYNYLKATISRRRMYTGRGCEVRYLDDVRRCIRHTIKQMVDGEKPGTSTAAGPDRQDSTPQQGNLKSRVRLCPNVQKRYNQHKKKHHQSSNSGLDDVESGEIQVEQPSTDTHVPEYRCAPPVGTMRSFFSPPCPCNITSTRKKLDEYRTSNTEDNLADTVEKIHEWLKDVSVYARDIPEDKNKVQNMVKQLAAKFHSLKNQDGDKVKEEIKTFIDNLHIWNPREKQENFKNRITEALYNRLLNSDELPARKKESINKFSGKSELESDEINKNKRQSLVPNFIKTLKRLQSDNAGDDIIKDEIRKFIDRLLKEGVRINTKDKNELMKNLFNEVHSKPRQKKRSDQKEPKNNTKNIIKEDISELIDDIPKNIVMSKRKDIKERIAEILAQNVNSPSDKAKVNRAITDILKEEAKMSGRKSSDLASLIIDKTKDKPLSVPTVRRQTTFKESEMRNIVKKEVDSILDDFDIPGDNREIKQKITDVLTDQKARVRNDHNTKAQISNILQDANISSDEVSQIIDRLIKSNREMPIYYSTPDSSLSNSFPRKGFETLSPMEKKIFEEYAEKEILDTIESIGSNDTVETINKKKETAARLAAKLATIMSNPNDKNKEESIIREISNQFQASSIKKSKSSRENLAKKLTDRLKNINFKTSTPHKDRSYVPKTDSLESELLDDEQNDIDFTSFFPKGQSTEISAISLDGKTPSEMLLDQEKKYTNELMKSIKSWIDDASLNLNEPDGSGFKDTMIKELAGDIVNRQKYLQLSNDARPSDQEELENLKYQILQWLNKFLDMQDMAAIVPKIDALINKIKKVDVPKIVQTRHRFGTKHTHNRDFNSPLKQNSSGSSEILRQETNEFVAENLTGALLEWLKHQQFYKNRQPSEKRLQEDLIEDLANGLISVFEQGPTPGRDADKVIIEEIMKHFKQFPMELELKTDDRFINRLATHFLEHLKTLQLFQDISQRFDMSRSQSSKDNLHLKVFKSLKLFIDMEDLTPVAPKTKDLENEITASEIPKSMEAIKDVLSKWVENIDRNSVSPADKKRLRVKIHELAEIIQRMPLNKETIQTKDILDKMSNFMKSLKINIDQQEMLLMAENLSSILKQKRSDSSEILRQDTNKFIAENLTGAILDWLKQQHFYKNRQSSEKRLQEDLVEDLANGLISVFDQGPTPGGEADKVMIEEMKKHLKQFPMEPVLKSDDRFIHRLATQLLDYLKTLQLFQDISQRFDTTRNQYRSSKDRGSFSITIPVLPDDFIKSAVQQWVKTLNLPKYDESDLKDIYKKAQQNLTSILAKSWAKDIPLQNNKKIAEEAIAQFLDEIPVNPYKCQYIKTLADTLLDIIQEHSRKYQTTGQSPKNAAESKNGVKQVKPLKINENEQERLKMAENPNSIIYLKSAVEQWVKTLNLPKFYEPDRKDIYRRAQNNLTSKLIKSWADDDQSKTNKKDTEEAISQFLDEIPVNPYNRHYIKTLADTLLDTIQEHSIKDQTTGQISKKATNVLLDDIKDLCELNENSKQDTNQQGLKMAEKSLADSIGTLQDNNEFIAKYLTRALLKWLKEQHFYKNRQSSEKRLQEDLIENLAKRLISVFEQGPTSSSEADKVMIEEILKHLKQFPLEPTLKSDYRFNCRVATQLLDHLKTLQVFQDTSFRYDSLRNQQFSKDSLSFRVLKWLKLAVDMEDLVDAVPTTEGQIKSIELMKNVIFKWIENMDNNSVSPSDKIRFRMKIHELFENLQQMLLNNEIIQTKDILDKIIDIMRSLKINIDRKELLKIAENLNSLLKENSSESSETLRQGTNENQSSDIFMKRAVEQWIKTLNLPKSHESDTKDTYNTAQNNLTTKLAKSWEYDAPLENNRKVAEEAISQFLDEIPVNPYKCQYIKILADNLLDIIQENSREYHTSRQNSKNTDVLLDDVIELCENLPIKAYTPEEKEIATKVKEQLKSQLINKIYVLKANPASYNDDVLEGEIDKILKSVSNEDIRNNLPTIKKNILEKIKQARQNILEKNAKQVYKQQLCEAISNTLPWAGTSPGEQASFDVLKDIVADAFMNLHYIGGEKEQTDELKKKIHDEVSKFCNYYLKKHPGAFIDSKKIIQDLYRALENVPKPINKSGKDEPTGQVIKTACDFLLDDIKVICENLPIKANTSEEIEKAKKIKEQLESKLIYKICELNMNSEAFNDDFLYENILEDEIDYILTSISNEDIRNNSPTIKKNIIEKVKQARQKHMDENAGQVYMRELRKAISDVLPNADLSPDEQASFDMLKDSVADAFINLHYVGEDRDQINKLKNKINDAVVEYCNSKKHPGALIDYKNIIQNLYRALNNVSEPKSELLKNEVELVKLKDLINNWVKELPLKKQIEKDKLQTSKMISVLAKKLHDFEKEKKIFPDRNFDERINIEVTKFMKKLPLTTEKSEDFNQFVTKLINNLKDTEETRSLNASARHSIELDINCLCNVPLLPPCALTSEDRALLQRIRERALQSTSFSSTPRQNASVNSLPVDAGSQVELNTSPIRICPGSKKYLSKLSSGAQTCLKQAVGSQANVTPHVIVKEYYWDSIQPPNTPSARVSCAASPTCPAARSPCRFMPKPCPRQRTAPSHDSRHLPAATPKPCLVSSSSGSPPSCSGWLYTSPCSSIHQARPRVSQHRIPRSPSPCVLPPCQLPCKSKVEQAMPQRAQPKINSTSQYATPSQCPYSETMAEQNSAQSRRPMHQQRSQYHTPNISIPDETLSVPCTPYPSQGQNSAISRGHIPRETGTRGSRHRIPCSTSPSPPCYKNQDIPQNSSEDYETGPSWSFRNPRVTRLGSFDHIDPKTSKSGHYDYGKLHENELSDTNRNRNFMGSDEDSAGYKNERERNLKCRCKGRAMTRCSRRRVGVCQIYNDESMKSCSKCCGVHCPYPSHMFFN